MQGAIWGNVMPSPKRVKLGLAEATLAAQTGDMKTALHFLWASLAATLAAMALLTITMPLTLLANTGSVTGEGFWPSLLATVAMLPFVTVIGGMVALPMAALAGGAMLWGENVRGAPFSTRVWIIAGIAAGLLTSTFVGTNDTDAARLIHIPWFACGGAMGAWMFARVWRRGARLS
jgi:hypothetical protein